MLKWEEVPQGNGFTLWRTPVLGGWLLIACSDVQTYQGDHSYMSGHFNYEWRNSVTFMPDPKHEWNLSTDYLQESSKRKAKLEELDSLGDEVLKQNSKI